MSDAELSQTAFLAQATAAITKIVRSIQEYQNPKVTLLKKPNTFGTSLIYQLGIRHFFGSNEVVFEIIFNFTVKEPSAVCNKIDIAFQMPKERNGNEQAMEQNVIAKIRELGWTKAVYANGRDSEHELSKIQQVLHHA